MNKTPVAMLTLLALLSSVGCAEVGNFFVPPHTKSDSDAEYASTACLYLYKSTGNKTESIAAVAATAALGLLIDRTAAAIKDESKRYQASYSARSTAKDFANQQDIRTATLNYLSLRFIRLLNKNNVTCPETPSEDDKTISNLAQGDEIALDLHAIITANQEIAIDTLTLNNTKAKVASARGFVPWSWWMLLDRSSRKVDLKATVSINTTGNGQSKDIISADIPLGKFDLDKPPQGQHLFNASSGHFALPECKTLPCEIPATVTVTITESNELGDVIGDAAKKVTDNKQSITNFFLGKLSIEPAK